MPLASPAADPAHRRSRLRLAAFVAGAALLSAACGGDDGTTTPASAGTVAPAADTVPETVADTIVETVPDTVPDSGAEAAPELVQPEGFTTAAVRITEADGTICEVCVWLADSADERSKGLMGVTDLGEAVGMLFVFEAPAVRSFYMFRTPTPLSIAWFAADGRFVDSTDMEPCLSEYSSECPRYAPDEPYRLALEVFEGGLDPSAGGLALGAGAVLEVVEGSESLVCDALGDTDPS